MNFKLNVSFFNHLISKKKKKKIPTKLQKITAQITLERVMFDFLWLPDYLQLTKCVITKKINGTQCLKRNVQNLGIHRLTVDE